MSLFGSVLSAGAAILGGNSANKAAKAEAKMIMGEAQATARSIRRKAREVRSTATAGIAASGVSVDEGTPLIIDEEIVRRSEEDAMNVLLSGKRRAKAARAGGKAAQQMSWLQAAGDLYTGWKK